MEWAKGLSLGPRPAGKGIGRDEMAQLPCLIQKLTLVYTEYPRVVVISVLKPDKPDLPFSGSEVLNYTQLHVHPP